MEYTIRIYKPSKIISTIKLVCQTIETCNEVVQVLTRRYENSTVFINDEVVQEGYWSAALIKAETNNFEHELSES